MTTDKVRKTIEERFRNRDLELQAVAFCMKRTPTASAILEPVWLAAAPLGKLLQLLRVEKVTLSKASALQQLKSRHMIKTDEVNLYESYLDDVMATKVAHLTEKSLHLMAQQLYELSESRRCLQGLRDVVGHLKDFDLRKTKELFRDLSRGSDLVDHLKAGDYLEDYEQRKLLVEEKKSKSQTDESVGITTGIRKFDQLCGGLMKGEFGVIAGKPAVGKTAVLVSLAINAWLSGKNVLFASGEMPKVDIQLRIDSNLTGVSGQRFRTGELEEKHFSTWRKIIENLRALQQSYLEVVSFPRNFTAEVIEAEALRVQEKWQKPLDLLCVDYLNIMDAVDGRGSSKDWKNQADAVWDLKELTADFNGGICTWTAGQIVDEAFEKEILETNDLKYARAISETAPIVVGLVKTVDDELEGTLQFQVLKMRNAPPLSKPILLHPDLDVMRIHIEALKKRDLLLLEDDDAVLRQRALDKKAARNKKRGGGRKRL